MNTTSNNGPDTEIGSTSALVGNSENCSSAALPVIESSNDGEKPYIFVHALLGQAPWQIAHTLSLECGNDFHRIVANIRLFKTLVSESFHDDVANWVFGQKLAGDLGIRSTSNHPKTDYGEPRFGSGWDLDQI